MMDSVSMSEQTIYWDEGFVGCRAEVAAGEIAEFHGNSQTSRWRMRRAPEWDDARSVTGSRYARTARWTTVVQWCVECMSRGSAAPPTR